jgi:hypothetical protein
MGASCCFLRPCLDGLHVRASSFIDSVYPLSYYLAYFSYYSQVAHLIQHLEGVSVSGGAKFHVLFGNFVSGFHPTCPHQFNILSPDTA